MTPEAHFTTDADGHPIAVVDGVIVWRHPAASA